VGHHPLPNCSAGIPPFRFSYSIRETLRFQCTGSAVSVQLQCGPGTVKRQRRPAGNREPISPCDSSVRLSAFPAGLARVRPPSVRPCGPIRVGARGADGRTDDRHASATGEPRRARRPPRAPRTPEGHEPSLGGYGFAPPTRLRRSWGRFRRTYARPDQPGFAQERGRE
jgi:hypothetical protein